PVYRRWWPYASTRTSYSIQTQGMSSITFSGTVIPNQWAYIDWGNPFYVDYNMAADGASTMKGRLEEFLDYDHCGAALGHDCGYPPLTTFRAWPADGSRAPCGTTATPES